jgi:hypothetical protein
MEAPVASKVHDIDNARRTVCQEFARLGSRGCGQFRVRWFPNEQRVQFQGERKNRWQSFDGSDCRGEQARAIAAAMQAIRTKRNRAVEVTSHTKPDHEEFEVRVPPEILGTHREQLAKFLEAQLFWD